MTTTGVILGKFMPPHEGHVALVRTAQHLVDRLTIILSVSDEDPIPSAVRKGWMQTLFPLAAVIVHNHGDTPLRSDDPQWARIIRGFHPEPIDRLIGSEGYIVDLARALGAQHFILDPMWMAYPADSRAIRTNPNEHWKSLPSVVRPWYQKRLTLVGPESTGKSYLADVLAREFGGPYVPEYGRPYEKYRAGGDYRAEELHFIVDGHVAHRRTLAMMAGPLLFEDTDPLLTAVWAEMLLGYSLPDLEARIELPERYLLLDPDIPWQSDPIRYFARADLRRRFYELTEAKLKAHGAAYTIIAGDYPTRQAKAIAVATEMLATPKRNA